MNILMLTLMYPEDQIEEVSRNVRDKLQNQINNYQHAFIEGIRANLSANEKLKILNCLPVGIFPLQYRKLFLRAGQHDDGAIQQLGCLNLPVFKQKWREIAAQRAIEKWAMEHKENRTLLVYTQYLPYMKAIIKAKKRFPDLRASVIVTDLPNKLGLATGRKGLLKLIEARMGRESLLLLRQMDGFILLTDPMADALDIRQKPYEVIEGLILPKADFAIVKTEPKPSFLYSGTLEKDLGIPELLSAFEQMPEYDLWICGHGTMKDEVNAYAHKCGNIHFYGFVAQEKALAMQANAIALLNPRQPFGAFTRYSFPSKTLEYMRSGKPVLCCRLEGIPADYASYLSYMDTGAAGIVKAVRKLMQLSDAERKQMGESAKAYVTEHKNPKTQCKKLLQLLRRL